MERKQKTSAILSPTHLKRSSLFRAWQDTRLAGIIFSYFHNIKIYPLIAKQAMIEESAL
jgi:hypothetical protein